MITNSNKGYYIAKKKTVLNKSLRILEKVIGLIILGVGVVGVVTDLFIHPHIQNFNHITVLLEIIFIFWGVHIWVKEPAKKVIIDDFITHTLQESSTNYEALLKAVRIIFSNKDYNEALPLCLIINELKPDDNEGLYYLGFTYLNLKRYEDALSVFNKYIISPITDTHLKKTSYNRLPDVHYYIGYAYFKLNNQEKADHYKQLAISKRSRLSEFHLY